MCVTATITDTAPGSSDPPRFYKACASSALCPITGSQTYELNLGVSGALISAECCDTDGCNNNTLPAHTQSQTPNGLQCFFCASPTRCDVSTPCTGDETLCIQGTLNNEPYGCASPSVCTASRRLGEIPLLPELGTFSSGPTCCDTENCNDGTTTTTPPTTTTTPPTTTTTPPTTTTTPLTTTSGGLKCLSCTGSCSTETTVTCSTETMCVTATITDTAPGSSDPPRFYKGCASSDLCPITGSQTYELNLGRSGALISAECCDTDGCNNNTLPAHTQSQTQNGLQCFFCASPTRCDVSIPCTGDETLCIQGTLNNEAYGCVSPSVCTASRRLGEIPLLPELGTFSSGPNCCDTNNCNDGTTTTTPPTTTTTPPTTTTTPPTTTTTPPTTTTTPPTTTTTPPTTTTTPPTTTTTPPTTTTTPPTTTTTPTITTTTTTTPPTTTTTPPTTTTTPPTTTTTPPTTTTTPPTTTTTPPTTTTTPPTTTTTPPTTTTTPPTTTTTPPTTTTTSPTTTTTPPTTTTTPPTTTTTPPTTTTTPPTTTTTPPTTTTTPPTTTTTPPTTTTTPPTTTTTPPTTTTTPPTTTTTPPTTTTMPPTTTNTPLTTTTTPPTTTSTPPTTTTTPPATTTTAPPSTTTRPFTTTTTTPPTTLPPFTTTTAQPTTVTGGLRCQSCTGSCITEDTVTCPADTMCVTATILETKPGSPGTTRIYKACASSTLCPNTGLQDYELDLGISSTLISAECCDTDECNNNTLPVLTRSENLNGLHCFFCVNGRCDLSFDCQGNETLCIQGTLTNEAYGCASPSVCTASRRLGEIPLLPELGTFSSGPNCCNTDECNDGTTTTALPTTTPTTTSTTTTSPTTTPPFTTTTPLTTTTTPPTTPPPFTTTTALPTTVTGGLRCQSCTGSCITEDTVTCPADTMCVTATILETKPGSPGTTRIYKACASSTLCPNTGLQDYELDLGISGALISAECCDTDECNNNTLPVLTRSENLNGLHCFFCLNGRCDLSFDCQGNETLCIQGTLTNEAYGCASPSVCTASRRLGELPLLPELGTFSSGPNCCNTDECNDGTTTTAPPTTTGGSTTTGPPTATPTTTTVAPTTTTTPPTTTTTASPTTTTAPPTTTTTAPPTTTTTAPTTTTTAPPTTTTTAPPTTTTTAPPTTTTTAPPTTTTTAPTTTTTAPTTTTTAPPTTTTTAPTTTTTAPPTTTTTAPPSTTTTAPTTTTAAPTTTTAAPTTTTTGPPTTTTTAPTTTTSAPTTTTAAPTTTTAAPTTTTAAPTTTTTGPPNTTTTQPTTIALQTTTTMTAALTTSTAPTTTTLATDTGLQCLSCSGSSCSSPVSVTCSSETMCITASIKDLSSGDESFFRGCAPPTLCPHNGTFKFSTDVVDSYKIIDAECCDTNNCNSETLPVPVQQAENGLECFFCLSGTDSCSFTVRCEGAQDRCFDGHVSTDNRVLPVAGCTSTDVCEIAPDHGVLPFMEGVGNLTSGPTCCGTNHCNDFTEPTTAGPTTTPMSTTVPGLQCLSCSGSSCSSPVSVTCSSETMCITASIKDVLSGDESFFRGCAPPTLCPHNGTFKFSTDVVDSYKIIDAECCDTNNCNSETLTVPVQQAENGLQCFFCLSGTDSCSFTVRCEGAQDRCFDGHVSTDTGVLPVAGCTSTDVCEIAPDHGVLPFMEGVGNLTSGPTCCGTNHCNDFTEPTTAGPTPTPMSTTGLQCLSCSDSSCSSPVSVTCSSETMCITASIKDVLSGDESFFRGCAPPTLCPHNDTFKFSTDVVDSYKIIDAECCDTNNCNSETLTVPVQQAENGLQCFFCLSGTDSCSFTVRCEGAQDRCFDGHVSTDTGVLPVAGCTSTDVCEIAPEHGVLPFMEGVGNLTSGPTCCGTNHCNDFTEPTTAGPTTTPIITTGLQCLSCSDSSCSSPVSVTCSSDTMCITASIKDVLSGDESFFRGCAPPTLCPHNGTFKFSTDVVESYKIIDAECCDTNNCNSETLTVPVQQAENGLQCFFCLSGTDSCSFIVRCEGAQDRCFDGHVSTDTGVLPVAGCTSTDVCEIAPDHGVLPFMEGVGSLTSGPTCCGTNNCNDFTEPTTAGPTTTPMSTTGLQCLSCSGSSCSSPVSVTCSSETMCITASIKDVLAEDESFFRGCAPPTLCPNNGTFKFSTDVVDSHKIIDAECCDTNNCNSENLPVPVQQADNGLQCFFCLSGTDICSFIVPCEGAQDRCFDGHVSTDNGVQPVAGCTSTDVCDIAPDHGVLPFMEGVGSLTSGPTCCGTNRCNDFTEPTTAGPTTAAPPLRCKSCTDSTCSSEVTVACTSETMCITASTLDVETNEESRFKGCAASSLCPRTGTFDFSTDTVSSNALITAECCNTENCNSENLPIPSTPSNNGHRCFFCIPGIPVCNFLVPCQENENFCFDGHVNTGSGTSQVAGCTTADVCNVAPGHGMLPLLPQVGNFTTGPNCCVPNLCNDFTEPTTAGPSTAAPPLRCKSCTDSTCSSEITITCTSETMCITASSLDVETNEASRFKGCAASSLCPRTGTFDFSTDVVSSNAIITAQCCNTENCNSENLPIPTSPPTNGQRCFFCIPGTTICNFLVQCQGEENSCFDGHVNTDSGTSQVAGCTTADVCEIAPGHGMLPLLPDVGNFNTGPNCCSTELCNDFTASRTVDRTSGEQLQCKTCTNSDCSSEESRTCSTAMCVSAALLVTNNGVEERVIIKGCSTPVLCPNNGTNDFSLSLGSSSVLVASQCCDSENCNTRTIAFPAVETVNGLECLKCVPGTSNCSSTLECRGTENNCFQGTVTNNNRTFTVGGCTSSTLCATVPNIGIDGVFNNLGVFNAEISCCNTSSCNADLMNTGGNVAPLQTTSNAFRLRLGVTLQFLGLLFFSLYQIP
ncbi:mucin-2-like [Gouania willdenowi]|uniref:mucin-2-like n=1 Tax=Gouania willdenowi TaxID=441366 RepID=UPI0010541B04|nr:mucin-2-like [Gouania willdenowi]